MNIESLTLGQIALFVTFVVALVKGIDFLVEKYNKPTINLEKQINSKLDKMQGDINITLEAVAILIQHEITGDHANDMENLHTRIIKYLTETK